MSFNTLSFSQIGDAKPKLQGKLLAFDEHKQNTGCTIALKAVVVKSVDVAEYGQEGGGYDALCVRKDRVVGLFRSAPA